MTRALSYVASLVAGMAVGAAVHVATGGTLAGWSWGSLW
jgi:hypothetical protein